MICPNCGREIPDGTICPCTLQSRPLSDNPAVNVIKTIGSSGQFLALAILFSLAALSTIFSSLGTSDMLYDFYYYASSMGMDIDAIYGIMDAVRSSTVVSAILSSVPAILTGIAMWIHYGSCRSTLTGNVSTAGLTICKVLTYISLASVCLAAFAILFMGGLVIFVIAAEMVPLSELARYMPYNADELKLVTIIVTALFMAFMLFFLGLGIAYQMSVIRTVNRTKLIAQSGYADDRISSYFIGMNYVLAAIGLISGLMILGSNPISGAGAICRAVGYIMMSLLLSRYRKAMNVVLFPPVQPLTGPMGFEPYDSGQEIPVNTDMPAQPNAPEQPEAPAQEEQDGSPSE